MTNDQKIELMDTYIQWSKISPEDKDIYLESNCNRASMLIAPSTDTPLLGTLKKDDNK